MTYFMKTYTLEGHSKQFDIGQVNICAYGVAS